MVVNSCVLDEYSNLTIGCSRSSTCISVYFIILYSFDFFNRSYLYFFHFSILFNIEIVFIYLLNLRSFCYWNFKNKFDFFPEGRGGTTWPYHPPPPPPKKDPCMSNYRYLTIRVFQTSSRFIKRIDNHMGFAPYTFFDSN